MEPYSVSVEELVNEFELELLTDAVDMRSRRLVYPDINRLAMQITGHFDYFRPDRVQIMGRTECAYLNALSPQDRRATLDRLFSYDLACVVISKSLAPPRDLLSYAQKARVPLLSTMYTTFDFMGEAIRWMRMQLAPRITVHGVLVDVYGEGVLIMGESGIGKSETALELIRRGHRFVSDDAVEIKKVAKETLIGSAPELIKYFIELRGIGIIDVRQMFGVQSIKPSQSIDIVIKLEIWDSYEEYDRVGRENEFMEFLGTKIVCHRIPIRPGRNLAVICESAAINHRQKKMGYDAVQILDERIAEYHKLKSLGVNR